MYLATLAQGRQRRVTEREFDEAVFLVADTATNPHVVAEIDQASDPCSQ